MRAGRDAIVAEAGDRVEAVVRLDPQATIYFYGARAVNARRDRRRSRGAERRQRLSDDAGARAHPAVPVQRHLLLVSLLIVGALDLDRAQAGRPAGPAGRPAGRRRAAGHRRRPVGAGAGDRGSRDEVGDAGHRVQPDDRAARGADRRPRLRQRPARQPPRLHRGGAVGRHRGHHLGRRGAQRSADQQLGRGPAQDRRPEPVGHKLAELAPELDRQLDGDEREDIIQFASRRRAAHARGEDG